MPVRSSAGELRADATRAVRRWLLEAGLGIATDDPLTITLPDGRAITLALEARAVVDDATATRLARTTPRPAVVVADLITSDARAVFDIAGIGWIDRRGHLRIVGPGVFIDRDVGALPRAVRRGAEPFSIRGAASMGVAAAHLIGEVGGVRPVASLLGLSPAAVSKARTALATAGLLDDGPSARRALFWLLSSAWHPVWVDIQGMPSPRVNLVASGTRAAAALGAPIISTADYPVELYASDTTTLEHALLVADNAANRRTRRVPAARVSVALTQLVAETESSPWGRVRGWPIAHPLFVGLDLAADPARGQGALDAWDPPGWTRAW